jgi:hypothetical protein
MMMGCGFKCGYWFVRDELAGQWLKLYFVKEVEGDRQAANGHTMFETPVVIRSTLNFLSLRIKYLIRHGRNRKCISFT